jgi:hypothetical protein
MAKKRPSSLIPTESSSRPDAARLIELLSQCYDDPDLFNSAILGKPAFWSKQREIAQSVNDYWITVAYTGNDIGKDYVVGTLCPWWLGTRKHSQVIITGPSQTVLGSVTWKEIRRAIKNSLYPLGMTVSQGVQGSPLRVIVDGDWGALGYSTTSVERASGQHNPKLLVIAEEASGIADEIYDAIDSLNFSRLLLIGNPIRSTGRFVDLIRQSDKDRRDGIPKHRAVNAIRVSSRESPDAELEKSPRGLADRTWIEGNERRHGKTSLWVKVHIDAEIPTVDAEQLIPEAWIDWAGEQAQRMVPADHPIHRTRRIACDLGEGVGRDSSAIILRDDWGIIKVVWGSCLGLPEAAEAIWKLARDYDVPDERISYDRVGIGRNFPAHLAARGILNARGYAGDGRPHSDDFVNIRAEAAWMLRNRLDPKHVPDPRQPGQFQPFFAMPRGTYFARLRDELRPLTYHLVGRRTGLLKKEDWAIILQHSPDLADALIQSFAFP